MESNFFFKQDFLFKASSPCSLHIGDHIIRFLTFPHLIRVACPPLEWDLFDIWDLIFGI